MYGQRRIGGGLHLAAQRRFLVEPDAARAAGRHPWGQIAGAVLLAEPAGDAALTDLKEIDELAPGQTLGMSGEDALAQIGGVCFHAWTSVP